MSNQIQRNGVKNTVAKRDNNSKAKMNNHGPKRKSRSVLGASTSLRTGLDRTKKKKVARKAGQHAPNPSSRIDRRSEPEPCQWDEALPSIAPWKKTGSSMNDDFPPTSNWAWSTDKSHTTGNWVCIRPVQPLCHSQAQEWV